MKCNRDYEKMETGAYYNAESSKGDMYDMNMASYGCGMNYYAGCGCN